MRSDLELTINNLKKVNGELLHLTGDFADEIRFHEKGPEFKFLKMIFENIKSPVAIIDSKFNVLYINPAASQSLRKSGGNPGINCKCWEIRGLSKQCKNCPAIKTMDLREVTTIDFMSPNLKRKVAITAIPLVYDGVAGIIGIFNCSK